MATGQTCYHHCLCECNLVDIGNVHSIGPIVCHHIFPSRRHLLLPELRPDFSTKVYILDPFWDKSVA